MGDFYFDMNGVAHMNFPDPIKVTFRPARTKLLPILNRGRVYPVPCRHLNQFIDPEDVIGAARLAHAFYSAFIDDAENYFVK